MELTDIFGGADKTDKAPITSASLSKALTESPTTADNIEARAQSVANAFDHACAQKNAYEGERARLLDEVEAQLAELKSASDQANEVLTVAKKDLQEAMETAGRTEVTLHDRPPIIIKTTKGAKKSITQKWLKKEFGDQKAMEIWKKVPNKPDKRELVIPRRFEDEPTH